MWVELDASLVQGDGAQALRLVLHVEDISGRKAESTSREAVARFQAAFTHAPIGMAIVELDGGIREANPGLCRMLGLDADVVRASNLITLTDPDDTDDLEPAVRAARRPDQEPEHRAAPRRRRRPHPLDAPLGRGRRERRGPARLRGGPGGGHHRAAFGRARPGPPDPARSPHRPRQPAAAQGPAPPGAVDRGRGAVRGDVPRPRPVQVRERHARARRGRRPAHRGGRAVAAHRPAATPWPGSAATSSHHRPGHLDHRSASAMADKARAALRAPFHVGPLDLNVTAAWAS